MAADIICIHQDKDGKVCGERDFNPIHDGYNGLRTEPGYRPLDGRHAPVPGVKCPTCDGKRLVERGRSPSYAWLEDCPACADSPVRGYVRAE